MKPVAAYGSLKLHRQKLAVATALFVGVMFWVLVVSTVVVVKTTGKSKAFAANSASLSISWQKPAHYVVFAGPSYADGSPTTASCSSTSSLSCSAPAYTFKPGAAILYNIKVQDANGAIIKTGSVTAESCYCTTAGRATVSWLDWVYAVAVYPAINNSCLTVVAECISVTTTATSYTASALKYSTNYKETVCLPSCGSASNTVIYNRTESTPAAPAPGCTLSNGTIVAGGSMSVGSVNDLVGPIQMVGAWQPVGTQSTPLGTLAVPYSTVTIPSNTPGGTYVVRVAANGVAYTCKTAAGGDLNVTVPVVLTCTFDLSSVNPGQKIKVWGTNGTNGQVKMQYVLNGIGGAVTDLGVSMTTTNNSLATAVPATIPQGTVAGSYVVRVAVGTVAVTCKSAANTDLTVSAPISAPSCNITATSVVAGQSLTVVHGGFSTGASITLFGVPGQFDTNTKTLDSKSALVPQNVVIPTKANEGIGYYIVIVASDNTLYTCTGGPFRVIVVTCAESDVDGDGSVSILDINRIQGIIGSKVGNVKYNVAYDFNQDGAITIADAMLAAQFFGQNCGTKPPPPPPVSCAIKSTSVVAGQSLVVTYGGFAAGESIRIFGASRQFNTNAVTSNSINTIVSQNVIIPTGVEAGPGYNIVVVTKSNLLVNCSGGPISIIVLTCTMADVDRDGSVTSLDLANISALIGLKAGSVGYNPFYDLNKDGVITRADVLLAGTFFGQKCPQATPILLPVTYPASATLCTDSPYEATLKWQNKGPGWFVDVSDDFEFKHYWNKKVDNLTTTVALTGFKGASTNPALQPGVRYWWRVWNTETNVSSSFELSVFRDWCHPPFDSTYPSGWPTENGQISQGPNTTYTHDDGNAEAIDVTRPIGALVKATLDGNISIICKDKASGQPLECTGLGNAIVLKSHNFTVTYAHFSGFGPTISLDNPIGQKIRFGDVIGYAGCTGTCDGSHVHYQFNGLKMAFTNSDNSYHYIPLSVPQGCLSESSCKVSW